MKKILAMLLLMGCGGEQQQQPREELWWEVTCPVTTDNIVVDTVRASSYAYQTDALIFYGKYDENIRQVPKTCFNKQIMN